jgi:hypothetical protein
MAQALLAYLMVAAAAAWAAWSLFLPRALKQNLRARLSPRRSPEPGKTGCDCGGGCHD